MVTDTLIEIILIIQVEEVHPITILGIDILKTKQTLEEQTIRPTEEIVQTVAFQCFQEETILNLKIELEQAQAELKMMLHRDHTLQVQTTQEVIAIRLQEAHLTQEVQVVAEDLLEVDAEVAVEIK